MKFSLNCIDPGTERIDFKKVSQSDIEEFHLYSLNKQIYEFLEFEPFVNIKESEEYIKKIINRIDSGKGDYRFLRLKNKSEIIGLVGMHSYNHSRNSIEYGFAISPIHQKKGLFKEVTNHMLDNLFVKSNIHRIYSHTMENNIPAIKSLLSIGFKKEGCLKDYYHKRGKYFNALLLAIIKNQYNKVNPIKDV